MALPTLHGMFGLAGPVFLRKLASDEWAAPGDEDALAAVATSAFPLPPDAADMVYSFFRVEDDEQMRRAVMGLNGMRTSATKPVSWAAFTPAEATGVVFVPVPEGTHCPMANRLHHDARLAQPAAVLLCRNAIIAGRKLATFTKAILKEMLAEALAAGCHSAKVNHEAGKTCSVAGCGAGA